VVTGALVCSRNGSPAKKGLPVALSEVDREILQACLTKQPEAWVHFVDRFLGLVLHVIDHTAVIRSIKLDPTDTEDLASEVFLTILADDYAVLRRFKGESSLATYLAVVARRVVVRELLKWKNLKPLTPELSAATTDTVADDLLNRDEVDQLLAQLDEGDARIVRMHYLEAKSYEEISTATGLPTNSIGPLLSRAKAKLRKNGVSSAT
jgi:RNA polymerase sigma-70 factor (ECF subfamily)